MNRIWVLGASDPEMERVEAFLRGAGEDVRHATIGGRRVTPGEAYRAERPFYLGDYGEPVPLLAGHEVYLVEGDFVGGCPEAASVYRIDHHRPGDYGYGRPPEEFLPASSLGQVIAELARIGVHLAPDVARPALSEPGEIRFVAREGWTVGLGLDSDGDEGQGEWVIPADLVLAAASDHCPGAAYRGQCPGVDPDTLMRWRVETRAAFQGRPVEDVLRDVANTSRALALAEPVVIEPCEAGSACGTESCFGAGGYRECGAVTVADMRGRPDPWPCGAHNPTADNHIGDLEPSCSGCHPTTHWPELPEAALRTGIAFLAEGRPGPDGRVKTVLMGAGEGTPAGRAPIEAFLGPDGWAARNGLVDMYGCCVRGHSGAYYPG